MNSQQKKIEQLKEYFKKKDSVILAFVFGSISKGNQRLFSDWDIAVYFKPYQYCELETDREYPEEHEIWGDLENILESNKVDFLVLNRASPSLLFSVLNSGINICMKARKLYINLLIKTHYEAVDWWNFTKEFYEIAERAKSISEEDKSVKRSYNKSRPSRFLSTQQTQICYNNSQGENKMKFKVVIMHDKEYDGYVVDVPELVGCMSQGKTIDEALSNIKDAIKGWIEVEKKHGRLDKYEESEIFLGEVTI